MSGRLRSGIPARGRCDPRFQIPDGIVVGTDDQRGRKVLGDVYRALWLKQAPLHVTKRRTPS